MNIVVIFTTIFCLAVAGISAADMIIDVESGDNDGLIIAINQANNGDPDALTIITIVRKQDGTAPPLSLSPMIMKTVVMLYHA